MHPAIDLHARALCHKYTNSAALCRNIRQSINTIFRRRSSRSSCVFFYCSSFLLFCCCAIQSLLLPGSESFSHATPVAPKIHNSTQNGPTKRHKNNSPEPNLGTETRWNKRKLFICAIMTMACCCCIFFLVRVVLVRNSFCGWICRQHCTWTFL